MGEKVQKPMPKWLKIIIFVVIIMLFTASCALIGISVYTIIKQKIDSRTLINVELLTTGDVTYTIKERHITNEGLPNENYTVTDLSESDLTFKCQNGMRVVYEITIEVKAYDSFRFRQYNLYMNNENI